MTPDEEGLAWKNAMLLVAAVLLIAALGAAGGVWAGRQIGQGASAFAVLDLNRQMEHLRQVEDSLAQTQGSCLVPPRARR